jgi:hypothetical protein
MKTGGQDSHFDVCALSQNSRCGGDLSSDRPRKVLVQWVKIGLQIPSGDR